MSDQHRQAMPTGRRRLVRTASVLFALMVCLLLVQAAAANADVMKKYRGAYKNKLASYERKMDQEYDAFSAWKAACVSHSDIIAMAKNDPELQTQIPQLEQAALLERSLLQDAVAETRDAIYANIAAFKAKAVAWFKTKADRNRFKSSLTRMRGGFVQTFSADESLMKALYALGTNADVAGASNEIMAAGMTRTTAEDQFEKGLDQLRALE